MPRKRNAETQIEKLDEAVRDMPDIQTHTLWVRLVGVLDSMSSEIGDVALAMRGDGNGEKGMLNRVISLEKNTARIQSDVRYALTLILISMGYEHDPEAALQRLNSEFPWKAKIEIKQFSRQENPGRRVDDNQTSFDKFVSYIVNRILPPLMVALIVGAVTFWVAVNSHLIAGP